MISDCIGFGGADGQGTGVILLSFFILGLQRLFLEPLICLAFNPPSALQTSFALCLSSAILALRLSFANAALEAR